MGVNRRADTARSPSIAQRPLARAAGPAPPRVRKACFAGRMA